MKRIILGILLVSGVARGDGWTWLVRCDSSLTASPLATALALRTAGVNVKATTAKRDHSRDFVCGQGAGTLLGFRMRATDVGSAKAAQPQLQVPPDDFLNLTTRVH